MGLFPKIQSPCPYQANLATIMDGSMCRMCKREVTDLTAMDDGARVAFFETCETEVCVSYAVPIRSALGAAALAAAAVAALPAAAQDVPAPAAATPVQAQPVDEDEVILVTAGRVAMPVHYIQAPAAPKPPATPGVPATKQAPALPAATKRS